jgi:nitrogen fixation NifU-like protein
MYSPQLLNHFEHPRNGGEITGADASVRVENPVCGDVLELSIKISDGRITAARFKAKGCVPSMACGSLLTEMTTGLSVAEAASIRREDVIKAIGGLPEASSHAAQLAVDALRTALAKSSANE